MRDDCDHLDVMWNETKNHEGTRANCWSRFNDTVVRAENVLYHSMLRCCWRRQGSSHSHVIRFEILPKFCILNTVKLIR